MPCTSCLFPLCCFICSAVKCITCSKLYLSYSVYFLCKIRFLCIVKFKCLFIFSIFMQPVQVIRTSADLYCTVYLVSALCTVRILWNSNCYFWTCSIRCYRCRSYRGFISCLIFCYRHNRDVACWACCYSQKACSKIIFPFMLQRFLRFCWTEGCLAHFCWSYLYCYFVYSCIIIIYCSAQLYYSASVWIYILFFVCFSGWWLGIYVQWACIVCFASYLHVIQA